MAKKATLVCRPCGAAVTVSDLGAAVVECWECGVELEPAKVVATKKLVPARATVKRALPAKKSAKQKPAAKAAARKSAPRKAAPKKKKK